MDLLKGLRIASRQLRWDDPRAWDHIVTSLGYRIPEMIDSGREEDAQRLLLFFAREATEASGKAHPLADLAQSLDVSGYLGTASIAYTLAYTKTRGGMGWFHLGDSSHAHLLNRAIELDRDTALKVLADELAYTLRGSWYSAGTSRHLIDRIAEWGDARIAEAAWREAFGVIAHRLPLAPQTGWFARLRADDIPDWTVDESLFALLIAKLSDPRLRQKVAALEGVVVAIRKGLDVVSRGLRWWLQQRRSTTSVLLVMAALLHSETDPFPISSQLVDVLHEQTASTLWGIRRFALILIQRLGRPVPPLEVATPVLDTAAVPTMSERRRSQLLLADVGNNLEIVSNAWPELPNLVLRRLHPALERDPDAKEHSEERYRLAWGRDGRSVPRTPVLFWESEVFVEALHTELTGLRAALWASGRWTPDLEDNLLGKITPDTFVHLGLAASRVARPQWEPPTLCTNGLGPLRVLDSNQLFSGWSRLALVERQYVSNSERIFERPREVVQIFAGAVAAPLGQPIPSDVFPFRDGEPSDWWSHNVPDPNFPARLPLGQLIRLTRTTDWLGDAFVLIPPIALRSYTLLDPPAYCAPMTWNDAEGIPAIRLRTWRVRNANMHDADPFEYEGADLIARGDIVQRLQALCFVELQELRSVERHQLDADDSED